jgi:hypothetical protein
MTTQQKLLRTPDAAAWLCCSQNHLKRSRDTHGGTLIGGVHYFLGSSRSAAILWDVDAIKSHWHQQGVMRTQLASQVIKELQAK